MRSTAKGTLTVFGLFLVAVIGGMAWLADVSGAPVANDSFVSGAWLIWLFVLWGSLVMAVIFMIAWLSETFERS